MNDRRGRKGASDRSDLSVTCVSRMVNGSLPAGPFAAASCAPPGNGRLKGCRPAQGLILIVHVLKPDALAALTPHLFASPQKGEDECGGPVGFPAPRG